MQVTSTTDTEDDSDSDDESQDIFKVFAAEKKRHAGKPSKLPEAKPAKPATLEVLPDPQVDPIKSSPSTQPHSIKDTSQEKLSKPPAQYRYQSTAEDQRLVEELLAWLLDGKLTHTTPAHILAASPSIRKDLVERLRVRLVLQRLKEPELAGAEPP